MTVKAVSEIRMGPASVSEEKGPRTITERGVVEHALSFLPKSDPHEGFLALLIFRRKWIIHRFPEKEEEVRNSFKGDQILVAKELLHSDKRLMANRLMRMLAQVLSPEFSKHIAAKGKVFNANELWKKYPYAFSLMITYEPRNILQATKGFFAEFTRKLLFEEYTLSEILNFDKEWQSRIHKTNRKNAPRYLLLDCENFESYEAVAECLTGRFGEEFAQVLRYRCRTPSGGVHVILEITDAVQELLFKRRILLDLEKQQTVELKTGGFLTHLDVGVNPLIRAF